jgi:peptidoglycan hydrolase-like protein with peptidoglycan-binding domain
MRNFCVKRSAMKRTTLLFVVVLALLGTVRADQTVQSVQQALTDQGFYYGNVTGEKSAETTAAVRRYQIRNGLQVTGELNSETLRSLNVSSNSASSRQVTPTSPVTQPTGSGRDDRSRRPLDSSPRSFGEPERRAEVNRALVGMPYELAPTEMQVRIVAKVQRQLGSRGYYRGAINGKYGRRTAFAVRTFQLRSGISPTGQLDIRTLDALALPARNMAYWESAPSSYGSRMWVHKKFKHGKWKAKWKKHHRGDDGDEYADEDERGNGDGRGHGHGDDD